MNNNSCLIVNLKQAKIRVIWSKPHFYGAKALERFHKYSLPFIQLKDPSCRRCFLRVGFHGLMDHQQKVLVSEYTHTIRGSLGLSVEV